MDKQLLDQDFYRWVKASDYKGSKWTLGKIGDKEIPVMVTANVIADVAGKTYSKEEIFLLAKVEAGATSSSTIKNLERDVERLKDENRILQRIAGRKLGTQYTYFKMELENMSEEWNETICESLDDVKDQLEYLHIHLDDDTETDPGEEPKVIITGIAMTPEEYDSWLMEHLNKTENQL